jgi:DNA polymerase-3 subunit beta
MKIYCNRSELNRAINNVSHSLPSKSTSPILEGILVQVRDNTMKLTTTDTNITITSMIDVSCNDSFDFVVPAKLFSAIIGKLYEDEMILDYDDISVKLSIRSAGSNSEIICFSADEFPILKLDEGINEIILDKDDVKNLIRKTAFSASADDINGILTGVLLEIKDGKMKMVGVDPYRIASYQIDVDERLDLSVVIPAKLINEAAKIINDEGDSRLILEVSSNKVILKFDNNKVVINTYSGKFIDYERILKKEGNTNVRVKRQDLIRSSERASILASAQNNNLIRFNVERDIISIKSLNEKGNIEEKVEIINDGDTLSIGMNSKYLKDALSVIDDEEILLNFKDSVTPCIIKPLKGDRYSYLILPIRMN